MKRILLLLVIGLISTPSARSQTPLYFDVLFGSDAPAHAAFLPPGGGALIGDEFSAIIYLDHTQPLSGRLLQLGDNGLFEPVSGLDLVFAGYPSTLGGGGSAFDLEKTVTLDATQIQNLLAGKWYAEVVFDQHTYLGQFVPMPEPATAALLLCAAAVPLLARRHRGLN